MITIPLWLEQSLAALLYRTFLPSQRCHRRSAPAIAILAVSSESANKVARYVASLGIRGILNFCYTDIDVAGQVLVENTTLMTV